MKLSVFSLFFVSLWQESLCFREKDDPRGLVFRCKQSSSGQEFPLLFDTDSAPESFSDSARRTYQFLIDSLYIPGPAKSDEIVEILDSCVLTHKNETVFLPIRSYSIAGSPVFSISAISAEYYAIFAAFGIESYPHLDTDYLLRISANFPENKYGCTDVNRISVPSEAGWTLALGSLGVYTNSSTVSLPNVVSLKARLSPLDGQIGLPSTLWREFVAALVKQRSAWLDTENRMIVDGCELLDSNNLPELVIGFPDGRQLRLWGSALYYDLGNGSCGVEVYENLNDGLVVLGAPFFKLGFIQLTSTGIVDMCPSRFSVDGTSVAAVSVAASPSSLQNGIWIGVTIGGFCLVVLITVFLVVRSVRKRKAAHRDCPNRSMIHDPSIAGSVGTPSIFDV